MERQFKTKITWIIKNFSTLKSEKAQSDPFIVGGCKWRLSASPKGNNTEFLFLSLEVVDHKSLPQGWARKARYLISIVNQNSVKRSKQNEDQKWFDENYPSRSHLSMFPLNEIHDNGSGFLVNDELKIVAEVEVLEVIGQLDVTEETSTMMGTIDQLFPSQVDFVNRIFERHPEIASECHSKNPHLMTGYMSLLRGVVETLRQSPQELSKEDLAEAYAAMKSMTKSGFNLLWLEKKFQEVLKKKMKLEAGETRMQRIKAELRELKYKCLVLEAQLKKETEMSAAVAPVSFDDVI